MSNRFRVVEQFKRIERHNPISGHRWTEPGPTTGYEVRGPFGTVARFKTRDKAVEECAAWEAYAERCYPKGRA